MEEIKYIIHFSNVNGVTKSVNVSSTPVLLKESSRVVINNQIFFVKSVDHLFKHDEDHPTPLVHEIVYNLVDKQI